MADTQTSPPTGPTSPDSNHLIMSILAYLGVFSLIPLLVEKEDKDLQWHAKNGLAMFICYIACWIAVVIITGIVHAMGCLFAIVLPLAGLAYLVLAIMGILKCYKREKFVIPVISDLAAKF